MSRAVSSAASTGREIARIVLVALVVRLYGEALVPPTVLFVAVGRSSRPESVIFGNHSFEVIKLATRPGHSETCERTAIPCVAMTERAAGLA